MYKGDATKHPGSGSVWDLGPHCARAASNLPDGRAAPPFARQNPDMYAQVPGIPQSTTDHSHRLDVTQ